MRTGKDTHQRKEKKEAQEKGTHRERSNQEEAKGQDEQYGTGASEQHDGSWHNLCSVLTTTRWMNW